MVTNNPWARFSLSGKAFFMFNNKPRPADLEFNKPPMFCTDLQITEDSELSILGESKTYKGVAEVKAALKALKVTVGERTYKGVPHDNVVKFQSKITEDTTELSRKPKAVDANGDEMPSTILIGNESFVNIRGSLPDYRKNPPTPGRRPMLPTFDAVQVIDLVEYKAPEGSGRGPAGFKKIEGGYTVGSAPSRVVQGEPKGEEPEDDGDVFAGLDDLPETPKTRTVVKKKA